MAMTFVDRALAPSTSSRTRDTTCCGSNGFTSTPSHFTCWARVIVHGLERPGKQQHGDVRQIRAAL